MDVYQAIGLGLVVYLVASSIAAHVWLLLAGVNRIKQRLELGQVQEDAAVRDFLAVGPLSITRDGH